MMKKILLLSILCFIVCSHTQGQTQVINEQFANYYDCITKGYLHSYNYLTSMYDIDDITNNKLAIKFACKDMSEPT